MPTAGNEITFRVDGEGILIGVDNGDPQSYEDYSERRSCFLSDFCLIDYLRPASRVANGNATSR